MKFASLRFSPRLLWCCGLATAAILLVTLARPAASGEPKQAAEPTRAAAQFFEAKVRPLLAEHCWKCHGDKRQRGSLRLDSLAAALEGGDSGPALVPGHPEKSLLLKALAHDGELKMPPDQKLPREQVEVLSQWVKMGAPWPGASKDAGIVRKGEFKISDRDRAHWAFQPLKPPAVPKVKDPGWVRNPIDAFVLAGLEAKGLKPNPPASKLELMRRAYYDLTGLPPTPQEVEEYLKDERPDAYERLIDRLLDSPRHGEKWARHWLDLVRFAETNSYERDNPKPFTWRYRDYVIRAFNADKPFDRFVREQLAGDELPDRDNDALIATAYYRLGIWDDEPVDRLQAKYDELDDIVATTSQVFLGLTVDCARCHDHKIDPIPQKDYYRLLAFFHNINPFRNGGPTDEVALLPGPDERAAYEARVKDLQRRRDEAQAAITAIEREFRAAYEKQGKAVRGGDIDDLKYRFYRDTWARLPDFSTIKHEEEGKLPRGLFDLSLRTRDEAFGFVFEGTLIVPKAGKYTFHLDSDDGARLTVNGKVAIDYDGIHGMGKEKQAEVELPQGRLPIKLEYFQNAFELGLFVAWSGPDFKRRPLSASDDEVIRSTKADFNRLIASEGAKVLGAQRFKEYQRLKKNLEALKKEKVPAERALCVTEAGSRAPETFVLARGNPHVKGAKVEAGFPQILGGLTPKLSDPPAGAKTTGRRTVLADWLVSKDNPLTPRVTANRIWQFHFGRGIVRSPNDFGLQGTRPTHPELLDWLASEFVAGGWRMKAMHRLLMTSNTYRMSSRGNAEALKVDPANDLLWRFDMRRLGAEEIRDSILAATGQLNLKMYGPGVYPEIPKEVLAGQSRPGAGWGKSPLEEQNRRSVYIHVKRSLLYPLLEAFDVAETDRSTAVRFATTQPTQALLMINSEFVNKQAKLFAERLKREAGDDVAAQVRLGLYLTTARPPADADVRRGVTLVRELVSEDGATPEQALRYFCLMALNLNEFVYLD